MATIWSYQEQQRLAGNPTVASLVPPPRLNFPLDSYRAHPGLMDQLLAISKPAGVQALAKELRDSRALLGLAELLAGAAGGGGGGEQGAAAAGGGGGDKSAAAATADAPAATPSPRGGSGTASPQYGAVASPLAPPTALPAAGGAPRSAAPAAGGSGSAAAAGLRGGRSTPVLASACSLQAALEAAAAGGSGMAAAVHPA